MDICSVCGKELLPDAQVTTCPDCGARLHTVCWRRNGGCTTPGCPKRSRPFPNTTAIAEAPDNGVRTAVIRYTGLRGKGKKRKSGLSTRARLTVLLSTAAVIIAAAIIIVVCLPLRVTALMEQGDYIAATDMLNKCPGLIRNSDELEQQVARESVLLACGKDIRIRLKRPSSMEIVNVGFYSVENAASLQRDYFIKSFPVVLMAVSAQNSYGGYATGFWLYYFDSDSFNWEFLGYCSSLSEGNLTDWDEINVCKYAQHLMHEARQIAYVDDLARVNRLLQEGGSLRYYSFFYNGEIQ